MSEGDSFVIGGDADEEKVFVLPCLKRWITSSVGYEAAKDVTERGAVELGIGKLDKEYAPRLMGDKWAQLLYGAAIEALRGSFGQSKIVAGPIECNIINQGDFMDRPIQIVAEKAYEIFL